MTTKNNDAIILLNPPYNSNTPQLIKDILVSCKSNDLSVIQIIHLEVRLKYYLTSKLIHKLADWPNKPINIIIDRSRKKLTNDILICCVLGTLVEVDLIKVWTFDAEFGEGMNRYEIELELLTKEDDNLLYIAANYFKRPMMKIH